MDIDELKISLKPLDLTGSTAAGELERQYFQFYGLDFEERFSGLKHYFGQIECTQFGIATHYFALPDAQKTCFIVHGYYDHSGLYAHLIEYCLQSNYSVVIYDLPGHGLSSGEQASIASFAEYKWVFNKIQAFFTVEATHPWVAVGQSTGAAIVMDSLLSGYHRSFSKVVLLAPLVRPVKWPVSKISFSLGKVVLKQVKRRFSVNSHDLDFLAFLMERDPLQARHLPLQWVGALKQWIPYFKTLRPIELAPLVVQGQEDGTVDWRYNLPVIEKKFPKVNIRYLETGRHHLVNESEDIRGAMFCMIDEYLRD